MNLDNKQLMQALLEIASKLCVYENSLTKRILEEEELLYAIQKTLRLFSLDSSNHEEKKTEIVQEVRIL